MEDSESTAYGALMVALMGQGVYRSLDEAFETVRSGTDTKCFRPQEELFAVYEEKRKRMKGMYERLY